MVHLNLKVHLAPGNLSNGTFYLSVSFLTEP